MQGDLLFTPESLSPSTPESLSPSPLLLYKKSSCIPWLGLPLWNVFISSLQTPCSWTKWLPFPHQQLGIYLWNASTRTASLRWRSVVGWVLFLLSSLFSHVCQKLNVVSSCIQIFFLISFSVRFKDLYNTFWVCEEILWCAIQWIKRTVENLNSTTKWLID